MSGLSLAIALSLYLAANISAEHPPAQNSVSEWLDMMSSGDAAAHRQAAFNLYHLAVDGFGDKTERAVGVLLDDLKTSTDTTALFWSLSTLNIIAGRGDFPTESLDSVLTSLKGIPPADEKAARMRKQLFDLVATIVDQATVTPEEITLKHAKAMSEAYKDTPKGKERLPATNALFHLARRFEVPPPELVAALVESASDDDVSVAEYALGSIRVMWLNHRDSFGPSLISVVEKALRREGPVQQEAFMIAAEMSEAAEPFIPTLIALAQLPDEGTAEQAANVLRSILPGVTDSTKTVLAALKKAGGAGKILLAGLLPAAPLDEEALRQIVPFLNESDDDFRSVILDVLVGAMRDHIPLPVPESEKPVMAAINSERPSVRDRAGYLVSWLVRQNTANASLDLKASLLEHASNDHEDEQVRGYCFSALSDCGPDLPNDDDSIAIYFRGIVSEHLGFKGFSYRAIGYLAQSNWAKYIPHVPVIIQVLKSEVSDEMRAHPLDWLQRIIYSGAPSANAVQLPTREILAALAPLLVGTSSNNVAMAIGILGQLSKFETGNSDGISGIATPQAKSSLRAEIANTLLTSFDQIKDENNRASALLVLSGLPYDKTSEDALIAKLRSLFYSHFADRSDIVANFASAFLQQTAAAFQVPDSPNALDDLKAASLDNRPSVRGRALMVLGQYGQLYVDDRKTLESINKALLDNLEFQGKEQIEVRTGAIFGIGSLASKASPEVVLPLVHAAKDDSLWMPALDALQWVEAGVPRALPELQKLLDDHNKRRAVAETIAVIVQRMIQSSARYTELELNETLRVIEAAISKTNPDAELRDVASLLQSQQQAIRRELAGRQTKSWIKLGSMFISSAFLCHLGFWTVLLFLYPYSTAVRTTMFWNPKLRTYFGLWYVQLLIVWLPPLRRLILQPFRAPLLEDARLDEFRAVELPGFFPELMVVEESQRYSVVLRHAKKMKLLETLRNQTAQIVLLGDSGAGKSTFMRWAVAQPSHRMRVFLRADRCNKGVIGAIAAKLGGMINSTTDRAPDPLLSALIAAGALDVYIDGLNEVAADTKLRIISFAELNRHCPLVIATQPISNFEPPIAAQCFRLLPLSNEQIPTMLRTLAPVVIKPLAGQDVSQATNDFVALSNSFLATVLHSTTIDREEMEFNQTVLSNPMDLSTAALLLAEGRIPDLRQLAIQPLSVAAARFQSEAGRPFPIIDFQEHGYQSLQNRDLRIDSHDEDVLKCLERFKLVVSREVKATSLGGQREWRFRHSRIADAFAVDKFVPRSRNDGTRSLWDEHLNDPGFRGVFLLLASLLDPNGDDIEALRRRLDKSAVESRDRSLYDEFYTRLERNRAADLLHQAV